MDHRGTGAAPNGQGLFEASERLRKKCSNAEMTQYDSHLRSKAEVLRVLARLGIPQETIADIAAQLSDPVDLHQAGDLMQAYGLTRDAVISRLGGSP